MPSATNEELQVTTAEEWDAPQGVALELPSGKVVRAIRSMDILNLLKAGRIPNPLGSMIQRMVDSSQQGAKVKAPDMSELGMDGLREMMKMVDDCVLRVVVEPKVIAPPTIEDDEDLDAYMARVQGWRPDREKNPGAIGLNQIDMDDRMFIFLFAQGMAADLKSFREEQKAALAPAPDGQAVQPKAKRASGRK
jgi:hypothetical protein